MVTEPDADVERFCELFGDRLDDPEEILRLTLALALPPAKSGPVPGAATGPTE